MRVSGRERGGGNKGAKEMGRGVRGRGREKSKVHMNMKMKERQ